MKTLLEYFIRYPIMGNLLTALLVILGLIGLNKTRSTFFPETETKFIVVQTVLPGASPEEIEEGIVAKIEDNLKGLSGIDRVTSVSSENSGTVTIEAKRGYNIDVVLQDVKNAVDQIGSFPANMESPTIFKREALTLALNFALSGNTDLNTLKRFARKAESDLLALEGISKVEISGFPDEEIEIAVREVDLRKLNLTFDVVAAAIRNANIEITGGTIKTSSEELLIRSKNKGYYATDLLDLPVASAPDGRRILLREVADLRDQWADNPRRSYVNGQPAVTISVSNTIDENLLDIADMVRAYVADFNTKNEVVKATIIRDGSVVLQQRIDLLTSNGIIGFILVVVILAMFLQVRLAFWVAIAIPVSFAGMFLFAPLVGLSINAISLFGMIIVVGILVDDGIVISENIYQHFERGKPAFEAAVDGALEVLPSVVSAVTTTMVAFGSFLFFEGITGDFFSDLSVVVILTLGISMLEGALILPAHIAHSKALHPPKTFEPTRNTGFMRWVNAVSEFFNSIQRGFWQLMDWMRSKMYAPALDFLLKHTFLGLVIPVVLFVLCIAMIGGGVVKTTFFPVVEGDAININLRMPAGTRESLTQQWLNHIEKAVWEVNEEIKKTRPDGQDVVLIVNNNLGPSTYQGNISVNLLDGEARQMPSLDISNAIRQKAGTIYGAESVTFGIASPFGKPVSVALFGDNLDELALAVNELRERMGKLSELRDITDSNQEGLREVEVTLKEKAYLLGLTPQFVMGQVRQGFFGAEAQRIQRGQDEVRIWVRYDEQERSSIGKLEEMRIRTLSGQTFPLKEIADVSLSRGVIAINRLDGKREIRVEAELASADVSATDMIATIGDEIMPQIVAKYPSINFSFEGQVRENAKTQNSSKFVLPLTLLFMAVIILLTFRSFGQTLSLLAIIPLGFIGVVFGHWIMGRQISILSFLGIIALVGVMVNDGLVLVSTHNGLVQEGKKFMEALREAAVSRFRAIFLTSVTTIAGLAPLIFEKSFQAQFLIPMAISVAFGLAGSTLLVLFTLPLIMKAMNSYKVWVARVWYQRDVERTEVEPALDERINLGWLWALIPVAIVALFLLISNLRNLFS